MANSHTKYSNSIDLGRRSSATQNSISLEVSRFAGNKPNAVKVITLEAKNGRPTPMLEPLPAPEKVGFSNSGNGTLVYNNLSYGIYEIFDVLSSGGRRLIVFISIAESGVREYKFDDLKTLYPTVFEQAEIQKIALDKLRNEAESIISEISKQRSSTQNVTQGDITATPEFPPLPNSESVLDSINNGASFEKDEYIALQTLPSHYIVKNPFVKADSANEAIEKAKAIVAEREREAEVANENAKGLPKLKGTKNQIKWSIIIRNRLFERNPDDPRLQKENASKYWIENRDRF